MMKHSVRFFLQFCDHCRTIFPWPLLSDFAYGEFIFHSQDGKNHVYSNAFEDPAWDVIKKHFDIIAKDNPKDAKRSDRFQWISSQCIDKTEGQEWTLEFICPNCQKHPFHYGDGNQYLDQAIPIASFNAFMCLDEDAKQKKIAELYDASLKSF